MLVKEANGLIKIDDRGQYSVEYFKVQLQMHITYLDLYE